MSDNYLQPQSQRPNIIITGNQNPSMDDNINNNHAKNIQPNAVEFLSQGTLQSNARLNFIKKVYMILICQLIITMGVCFFSYFYQPFFQFQINYWWVSLIFLAFVIIFFFTIQCTQIGRRHPFNLVLLIMLTLCFSYIISCTTSVYANVYGGSLVIEAVAITIALVVGLTFYAFVTRTDFTTWIAIVLVVLICFIFFGITCAVSWNPILYSLFCCLGAIIAGILLVIDTQMIVGGNRAIQISMDDYVLGALIIYLDIVRLFLYVLMAMGGGKKR